MVRIYSWPLPKNMPTIRTSSDVFTHLHLSDDQQKIETRKKEIDYSKTMEQSLSKNFHP